MDSLIGALLGLLGVLIATAVGYRQWRSRARHDRHGKAVEARALAYQRAWELMEEVHMYVRSQGHDTEAFDERVRAVNQHLIKTGLLFETGEKKQINEYLEALRAVEPSVGWAADRIRSTTRPVEGSLPPSAGSRRHLAEKPPNTIKKSFVKCTVLPAHVPPPRRPRRRDRD
jgi:hypothetical protein